MKRLSDLTDVSKTDDSITLDSTSFVEKKTSARLTASPQGSASRVPTPRGSPKGRIKSTAPSKPYKVLALIDEALQSSAVLQNDARLRRQVRRLLFRGRTGNERTSAEFQASLALLDL